MWGADPVPVTAEDFISGHGEMQLTVASMEKTVVTVNHQLGWLVSERIFFMKQRFLEQYGTADPSGRFALLMDHVNTLIMDVAVEWSRIKRDIKAEIVKQNKERNVPLGTRVQESGKQDPTGETAVTNAELDEAFRSGAVRKYVQENIDHPSAILKDIDDLVQLCLDFDFLLDLMDTLAGGDWLRRHLMEHIQLKEIYGEYARTYEIIKDRKAAILKALEREFVASIKNGGKDDE